MKDLLKVTAVQPISPGHLLITWDDGVTRDVDVTDQLTRHPLLKMLNIPEVFRDVEVVNGGGGIGWANGADFCAQALRMRSDELMKSQTKIKA